MKTIYSRVLAIALLAVFSIVLMSQTQKQDAWVVPDNYKTMKSPVKADNATINIGKTLYMKNCASCHGKTGLGDGPKAKSIKTSSGDMTSDAYQNQTDGEHFYKTKFGRGDMPKYDKKIPDEDIWAVVHYMRTFKKK
jgi:mono/diheme cytochrome c family protein